MSLLLAPIFSIVLSNDLILPAEIGVEFETTDKLSTARLSRLFLYHLLVDLKAAKRAIFSKIPTIVAVIVTATNVVIDTDPDPEPDTLFGSSLLNLAAATTRVHE